MIILDEFIQSCDGGIAAILPDRCVVVVDSEVVYDDGLCGWDNDVFDGLLDSLFDSLLDGLLDVADYFLHRRRNRHTDWKRVLQGLVLVDEFAYYALWFLPVGYPVVAIVDARDRVLGVVPRGEPLGKKANEGFLVVWAGFFFDLGHDLKDRIGAIQYILKHDLEIFCRRPIGIVCGEYVSQVGHCVWVWGIGDWVLAIGDWSPFGLLDSRPQNAVQNYYIFLTEKNNLSKKNINNCW